MARAPKTYRVTIANVGRTVDCAASQTILEAAITAGIDYPYSCASGNCGTCASHLDEGKVSMLPRGDAALSPQQVKAGHTLACRARPRSDAAVTWLSRGGR
jgi:CDP-4-dehydro-6-deoxyglucose reductase/ferredoxin-NAD(P)+ reductase (naphthalene dioxygenase ferredoxin-specific)